MPPPEPGAGMTSTESGPMIAVAAISAGSAAAGRAVEDVGADAVAGTAAGSPPVSAPGAGGAFGSSMTVSSERRSPAPSVSACGAPDGSALKSATKLPSASAVAWASGAESA